MIRDPFPGLKKKRIAPAEYCFMRQGGIISTLLGSCVAACLYDPTAGIAGMNHFMLSNKRYAKDMSYVETESGRYGVNAMELLINDMLKAARRDKLRAKVFGGAVIMEKRQVKGNFVCVTDNFFCVGSVNCRFIQEFLATERIPLITADLGGEHGRMIYFDTRDYSVYVRKIQKTQSLQLAKRDHVVWQREVREHEHHPVPDATVEQNVELWV